MTDIYNKFKETVETRNLIFPGDKLLLSLSAGKDSMAMLDLILRHNETVPIKIGIFHLNHLMRGVDSDNDASLVRDKAVECGVPFYERRFNFKTCKIPGRSFEEHARDVRYAMIDDIMNSEGFNKAVTAHNSQDNIETLLMRIFSGTGIFGLRGISYNTGNIIRPLLDIYPDEIYSYLKNRNLQWREDLSNSDNEYKRNYIRNIIFPAITKKFPDAAENIARLSRHAEENENLLSFLSDRINQNCITGTDSGHFIITEGLVDNIPFIKYMLSRTLFFNYNIRLNSVIFEEIIRKFKSPKSNLPLYQKDNIIIKKVFRDKKNGIEITDKTKIINPPEKWEYNLNNESNASILITEIDRYLNYRRSCFEDFTRLKEDKRFIFINIPENTRSIQLRNRRDGDRILLEKGTKKIKELMIEKKLDTRTKKSVPLIVIDGEIAAYLPGIIGPYPDRVSCNFWINDCTKNMFVFYFTDLPDFNITDK